MARFKRATHNAVLAGLGRLDAPFLEACGCHFGGGTRIVLELGEYRESKDIGFLCADVAGYRALRETIRDDSLGKAAKPSLALARPVRGDQYGVRTILEVAPHKLKFEIVRESRIALAGVRVRGLPVSCLSREHCFAEKFLANADRGLDASTLCRDAVDLAFMVEGWGAEAATEGAALARSAYGTTIDRALAGVLARLRGEKAFRTRVVEGLAIEDTKTLSAGLEALAKAKRPRGAL
jgi:hypothetical protein